MKRANLYTLIIVTFLLLLFCLAAINANAQEAGNDESPVTDLDELIDDLFAQEAGWARGDHHQGETDTPRGRRSAHLLAIGNGGSNDCLGGMGREETLP